jgi:hypothetical protein
MIRNKPTTLAPAMIRTLISKNGSLAGVGGVGGDDSGGGEDIGGGGGGGGVG